MREFSLIVILALVALMLSTVVSAQTNLLVDPGMQSLQTNTWTRTGTAAAVTAALWPSQNLGWSNGHGDGAPNYYAVTAKRAGYAPDDTSTQARGYWTQKVNISQAGNYKFSAWYKISATANRTSKWDGPGGADQCAVLAIELHYTDGVTPNKWVWSPKAETVTPTWTQTSVTASIPAGVDYVNVRTYAWLLDQWVNASDNTYVAWDDANFSQVVPEPGSLVTLLCGMSGLVCLKRRRS